jgi:anti-anti-sigma factor
MVMTENQNINALRAASFNGEPTSSTRVDRTASTRVVANGRPRVAVQVADGFVRVDIVNAEVLLGESVIQELSTQLHRLIGEGHTRMLLNFGGVQYMSSQVLGMLAGLHQRVKRRDGRLGLCGLDQVMRDMMRICHLDREFKIYADQVEATSDGLATGDGPRLERFGETRAQNVPAEGPPAGYTDGEDLRLARRSLPGEHTREGPPAEYMAGAPLRPLGSKRTKNNPNPTVGSLCRPNATSVKDPLSCLLD